MENTLSSLTFRLAVLALEKLGIDTAPLLNEVQISKAKLINPLGRISISKEHKFWNLVSSKTAEACLTLQMADNVPFGTFPLLEYIGASSQSLFQSLVFFNKFAQAVYGDWHTSLIESKKTIQLNFGVYGTAENYRFTNEFGFGFLVNRLRYFSGREIPLLQVHFRHKLVGSIKPYEDFFRAKVSFEQADDYLIFDKAIQTIPCRNSDNFMLGSLLNLAEKLFVRLSGETSSSDGELMTSIKTAIMDHLSEGEPKIQDIAKSVVMSTRTLQRKLEASGTSLSKIVMDLRKEMASDLFKNQKITNEEIALRLGYSTVSAFNRAFKQWHKMTPSKFRKLSDS